MASKKVLVLHGYAQNATVFSKRLGAIRKTCGQAIDFVFVDAPHVLLPADLAGFSPSSLGASEVVPEEKKVNEIDPSELPRGWWRSNPERTRYDGVAESLEVLRDILAKDHYEGVFGFSQGASMAALLSSVLERPHLHPPFLKGGQAPHPPFKFCIAASGFKPNDARWAGFFTPPFTTPTLHILGENDVIVHAERSRTLVDASACRRVVEHDGGHFIPSKAPWRNFIRDFLRDPLGPVPAPPGAKDSAPEGLLAVQSGNSVSNSPAVEKFESNDVSLESPDTKQVTSSL